MGTTLNVEVWDTTAANNDDADGGITWTEGQFPSTVNNSARGMMAAVAKWKLDISGGIVAGGTGNAITLTTNRSISSGHITNGFMVFFRASASNSGATTVAIDGLTAKDVKAQDGSALAGGEIVSGGIYILSWSSAASAFILINAASSVTASSTVTFTNKTINADNNTVSNLEVDNFKASAIIIESEGIGSNDNDTTLPTSAAVKDYVDGRTTAATASEVWAGSSTSAVITPAAMASALEPQTLTRATTTTINFANGINFNCAMDGNGTLAFSTITSAMVGRSGWVKFTQDGTGSRTMAFTSSTIDSINSEALVLSTQANAIDVVNYTILSTSKVFMAMARRIGT